VTYYDFRYPNATHLMLIVEWVYNGTDSFEINIPGSFAYYERSWSLGTNDRASYQLDGVTVSDAGCLYVVYTAGDSHRSTVAARSVPYNRGLVKQLRV
jgi:hypothetical protein